MQTVGRSWGALLLSLAIAVGGPASAHADDSAEFVYFGMICSHVSGEPLSAAKVQLVDGQRVVAHTVTDDTGRYAFGGDDGPLRRMHIHASAPGHLDDIDVATPYREGRLSLRTPLHLVVEVRDSATKSAIIGARLVLRDSERREKLMLDVTGSDGRARVTVPSGTPTLTVEASAHRLFHFAVPLAESLIVATKPIEVALIRSEEIGIRVVDDHGSPLRDCEFAYIDDIFFRREGELAAAKRELENGGDVTFAVANDGKRRIRVSAAGCADAVVKVDRLMAGGSDLDSPLIVELPRARELRVRVRTAGGFPCVATVAVHPSRTVTFATPVMPDARAIVTDESGEATIRVPERESRWSVKARTGDGRMGSWQFGEDGSDESAKLDVVEILVRGPAGKVIHGIVADEDGTLLAGVEIGRGTWDPKVFSDRAGRFEIEVDPDETDLMASLPGYRLSGAALRGPFGFPIDGPVMITMSRAESAASKEAQ
jgi:hypothetical protein